VVSTAAGVVAVSLLVTTACGDDGGPEAQAGSPVTDTVASRASYAEAPCPNPIYGTGLDLGAEFTCGYLTVPENRDDPDSPMIRLAVATLEATAPDPHDDPIVFLTGGPGGSGLGEGPGVAQAWRRDRDVIFFDQRGTLKSEPFLACPEVDEFMTATVGMSWSDPATASESAAVVRTCRDRHAAGGVDLAMYNTTASASDVADLRVAMGYDEWNLYGVSYGTDLALQILRDHPAGIRSVVVDAVVPPSVNPLESGWRAGVESATAIYDACAADPLCDAAFPEGQAEYVRVLHDLAAAPRTIEVIDPATGEDATVVIDAIKLAYTVAFSTLIGSATKMPAMIHDLAAGDGTSAALEVLAGVFPPSFNSYGLMWGVLCREMAQITDLAAIGAAGRRDAPTLPTAVTEMPAMFPWAFTDCAAWDVPTAPADASRPATSAVPVLLTSGAFDATAPPSYAAEAARTLSNSTHVIFPGTGHSASRWAPSCFADVMASFLEQPGTVDQSCLATFEPPAMVTTV
jgi:pimeloyl-ACP methyl ester carboxylesterase